MVAEPNGDLKDIKTGRKIYILEEQLTIPESDLQLLNGDDVLEVNFAGFY